MDCNTPLPVNLLLYFVGVTGIWRNRNFVARTRQFRIAAVFLHFVLMQEGQLHATFRLHLGCFVFTSFPKLACLLCLIKLRSLLFKLIHLRVDSDVIIFYVVAFRK